MITATRRQITNRTIFEGDNLDILKWSIILACLTAFVLSCGTNPRATATARDENIRQLLDDASEIHEQLWAIIDLCDAAMELPHDREYRELNSRLWLRLDELTNHDRFDEYFNSPLREDLVKAERIAIRNQRSDGTHIHPSEYCKFVNNIKRNPDGPGSTNPW